MPILSENRSVPIHPFPILGVVLRSHRSVFDIWIGSLSTDHVSVLREAKEDAASRLKTWINIKFYMYYNKLLWLCHSKIWWSFSLAWASGQTGLARRSNSDVGFSSGLRTSVLAAWDFLSGRFLRGLDFGINPPNFSLMTLMMNQLLASSPTPSQVLSITTVCSVMIQMVSSYILSL